MLCLCCVAGNPPSACDMARDKAATRRLMAAAGLPSPKYTTILGRCDAPGGRQQRQRQRQQRSARPGNIAAIVPRVCCSLTASWHKHCAHRHAHRQPSSTTPAQLTLPQHSCPVCALLHFTLQVLVTLSQQHSRLASLQSSSPLLLVRVLLVPAVPVSAGTFGC
jgi:hypothetical protein